MRAALGLACVTALALWGSAVDARDWAVYTHSVGAQAEADAAPLRGRPHAGKRAYYLELVRAMLRQLGYDDSVQELPLARGLMMVQTQDRVALFNVSRTPDREDTLRWVGPISQETDYFYESTGAPTGIGSLQQAQALPVCVLHGSAHDTLLSQSGFTQINRNRSYVGCFRMLVLGRVKLVVSTESDLAQKLHEAQIDHDKVRATAVVVNAAQGYIALSRSTPDAEVARWNQALEQLRDSGHAAALAAQFAR